MSIFKIASTIIGTVVVAAVTTTLAYKYASTSALNKSKPADTNVATETQLLDAPVATESSDAAANDNKYVYVDIFDDFDMSMVSVKARGIATMYLEDEVPTPVYSDEMVAACTATELDLYLTLGQRALRQEFKYCIECENGVVLSNDVVVAILSKIEEDMIK